MNCESACTTLERVNAQGYLDISNVFGLVIVTMYTVQAGIGIKSGNGVYVKREKLTQPWSDPIAVKVRYMTAGLSLAGCVHRCVYVLKSQADLKLFEKSKQLLLSQQLDVSFGYGTSATGEIICNTKGVNAGSGRASGKGFGFSYALGCGFVTTSRKKNRAIYGNATRNDILDGECNKSPGSGRLHKTLHKLETTHQRIRANSSVNLDRRKRAASKKYAYSS